MIPCSIVRRRVELEAKALQYWRPTAKEVDETRCIRYVGHSGYCVAKTSWSTESSEGSFDSRLGAFYVGLRCQPGARASVSYPVQVSVVIPAFNRLDLLSQAIESVFAAAGALNVEVIVVDDASSEDVPQVLVDRAVTYKRLTQNSGSSVARNVGLAQSSGKFVKFLDSDDVLMPGSLQAEYQAACTGRADIVVCDWIETQLSVDGTERVLHHREAPLFSDIKDDLLNGLAVPTSAALYEGQLARNVNWNPELSKLNDWDYFVKAAFNANNIKTFANNSYRWRQHDGERITSSSSRMKHISEFYVILDSLRDALQSAGALTERRRARLAQYWYKELRYLYRYSRKEGANRLRKILELDPHFVPRDEEPSGVFRAMAKFIPLGIVLPVYGFMRGGGTDD